MLEKRLLKIVNRAFLGELSSYCLFGITAGYVGITFTLGNLNFKILSIGLLLPGALLSGGTHYTRYHHSYHIEEKLIESYNSEYKKYSRFFRDDEYELEWIRFIMI